MKAGAIILSGGKSSRMGSNKALLKFDEKPNIERIRDELLPGFDDIILVTNEPENYQFLNLKTVSDQYKGMGPLGGIHAGLLAAVEEDNLVAACDMPFISGKLAASLIEKSEGFDAVVPIINGIRHPLFAVYKKKVVHEIEHCLLSGNLRMKHLLDRLQVRFVTEADLSAFSPGQLEHIFFNMNHPVEYENAKRLLKKDD